MGDVRAEIALAMHILHERPLLWSSLLIFLPQDRYYIE